MSSIKYQRPQSPWKKQEETLPIIPEYKLPSRSECLLTCLGILFCLLSLSCIGFCSWYIHINNKAPRLKNYVMALYLAPSIIYHITTGDKLSADTLYGIATTFHSTNSDDINIRLFERAIIKAKTDPDYNDIMVAIYYHHISSLSTNSKIKMGELYLETGYFDDDPSAKYRITIAIQQAKMGNSAAITYIDQVWDDKEGIDEEVENEYFASISPPIKLSMRSSFIAGYVVQIKNDSDIEYLANIFVENPASGEKRTYKFTLSPNELQELGMNEMNWKFLSGERGYIEVEGYPVKLCFYLIGEQYHYAFHLNPEVYFQNLEEGQEDSPTNETIIVS